MTSPVIKEEGFSVRELRSFLSTIPDVDGDGNENKVYIACGNLQADVLTLCVADEDDDAMLIPGFWHDTMAGLETLDDFLDTHLSEED